MSRPAIAIVVTALLCAFTSARAAEVRNIFDARVPMRDGVELSADIWLPAEKEKHPAILIRTPYVKARGRLVPFAQKFVERGYAVLLEDVRGRGDSDGVFLAGGEGNDGYDSIEWIARQPWSNGDVCMMGGSYLAAVQWAVARLVPPHLKCIAPTATGGGGGVGGALMLGTVQLFNLLSGRMDQRAVGATLDWQRIFSHRPLLTMDEALGRPMPLYRKTLTMRDPSYDMVVEKRLGVADFGKIRLRGLHIGGWFDPTLATVIRYWDGMAAHSPAKGRQHLLIGPWDHWQTFFGGKTSVGEMEFTPDSVVDTVDLHAQFFAHYLKGGTESFDFPRVRLYVTGSNRWRDLDAYPPRDSRKRRFFLGSSGKANTLDGDGVLGWNTARAAPSDSFIYDPENPAPAALNDEQFASDHREIEKRQDVLVYTGEVLDQPLEIIGPVVVELFAATDGRDTDFTAKLLDVYPDGRAVKLGPPMSGIVRARHRNGLDREELLTPGKVERYVIELSHIGHAFLPGHRVRVEISSSSYPEFNPNQNTGNPIATDTEWRVAQQTVYHDGDRPSALVLPVFTNGID